MAPAEGDTDYVNGHGFPVWPTKIIWAQELAQQVFEPVEWLIEGILPHGLAIIAGKSKIGKSWLVLHIALAIAGGRPIFGKIATKQAGVLYLALEDNPRRLQDRINKLLGDDPVPAPLGMFTDWVNVDDGCFDRIDQFVELNPECKLVIIDTFGKVRGRPDGKSSVYIQDYRDMGAFKALADKHKIAILLVHHTRKQDASDALDLVSGSTGLVGAADTIMVLTRPRGQTDGLFIVTGRDIKDDVEQAAKFDRETGRWELLGIAEEVKKETAQQSVYDYLLAESEPVGPVEIASETRISINTVKTSLKRLKKRGSLECPSPGLWQVSGRTET